MATTTNTRINTAIPIPIQIPIPKTFVSGQLTVVGCRKIRRGKPMCLPCFLIVGVNLVFTLKRGKV